MVWQIPGLIPSDQKTFLIHYTAQAPPSLNLGDTLISSAYIFPSVNDITPIDNRSDLTDIMQGSYDPNDKICNVASLTPGEISNGNYITYTIRFENTGTDTAFGIFYHGYTGYKSG